MILSVLAHNEQSQPEQKKLVFTTCGAWGRGIGEEDMGNKKSMNVENPVLAQVFLIFF